MIRPHSQFDIRADNVVVTHRTTHHQHSQPNASLYSQLLFGFITDITPPSSARVCVLHFLLVSGLVHPVPSAAIQVRVRVCALSPFPFRFTFVCVSVSSSCPLTMATSSSSSAPTSHQAYYHHIQHQSQPYFESLSASSSPPSYRPQSMMGLLTTVAELPHSYKMRYIKVESPLDLSVKQPLLAANFDNSVRCTVGEISPTHVAADHTRPDGEVANTSTPPPMTPPRTPSPPTTLHIATVAAVKMENSATDEKRFAISVRPPAAGKRKANVACDATDRIAPPSSKRRITKNTATINRNSTTNLNANSENVPPPTETFAPMASPNADRLPPTERTPNKPIRISDASAARMSKSAQPAATKSERKSSAKPSTVRKLKFDEYKSSPVSGTIIRTLEEIRSAIDDGDDAMALESGDIDPEYNIVEVTDEVRAEIATIPNVIGGYACKLCRTEFEDVFGLARHRCSCIVLLDYKCPECGKRFNCPANLASHRRWHKPRPTDGNGGGSKKAKVAAAAQKSADDVVSVKVKFEVDVENTKDVVAAVAADAMHSCAECGKTFKRQAYLRKHQLTHRPKNTSAAPLTMATIVTAPASNHNNQSDETLSNFGGSRCGSNSPAASECSQTSRDSTALVIALADEHPRAHIDEDHNIEPEQQQQHRHHFRMFDGGHSSGNERFTEEENMAASVLAHLRNGGPSVIRHTTVMMAV